MIDLSFLTEEEQEAIMKVLQRDAELKRAEEERVRHLPEKVKDDVQLKNMSGQWFYEAKSKRHRDKIHGADIIRASMRRKPATLAEVSQSKSNKAKNSWVSNVNKEVFVPPELHGIVEHQEEQQLQSCSSSKTITSMLDTPEERPTKAAVSPVKQRRNPFNFTASGDNLNSEESEHRPAILPQLSNKEILSPSEESQPKPNLGNDEAEKPKKPSVDPTDETQKELVKRPVPKARKLIHKATAPVSQRDDVPKPAKRTERINGTGTPPRGILKRSSSSSSTDSEVRVSQMLDVQKKNGLPTATIFEGEAEKNSLVEEAEDSTQISLEKLKQVRFSSGTGEGEPLQSPQLHHSREQGEFDYLESDETKSSENDALGSDMFGNKQTSAAKPLGTCSSALQVKTIDDIQNGSSASSPCDTNRSVFPVNESLQAKTVNPKKPETPQKTSKDILPNSSNKPNVDTCESETNQFLSEKSKPHKSINDEHQLSAKKEVCVVPNTNFESLQQGKPHLVEEKTAFKPDKHADELVKVADESVSRVLDWFKRSSGTEDRKHVSARSQDREPKEDVGFSTRTAGLPTQYSMDRKTEVKEELQFGKLKQQKSISSTSFISEDKQLIKERMEPKKEEENERQSEKSLTGSVCARVEEIQHGQEITQPNQKTDLLVHQEHEVPAQKCELEKAVRERRRIREIRAFWEGNKTFPSYGEKEVDTNASGGSGQRDKIKPMDDQSKNTLRGDELSCASQASRNKHQNSFEFGRGHAVQKPESTLLSDGKVHENTELPKASNLQPRFDPTSPSPESKGEDEKETLKGKLAATSQQKPSFHVFSSKEKMNENSKDQISDPSHFQSLRNFWDNEVKLQSSIDRVSVSSPNNTSSITYERKEKEDDKGRDKRELIQQQNQTLERETNQKPDSVICGLPLQSPALEGLNLTHTKNRESVQLGRKAVISKPQESVGLPEQEVKDCVGKSIVSSKEHHVSLQLHRSPGDKDTFKEEAEDDCLCLSMGKVENTITPLEISLPREEVAETVDKVVLTKAEFDVFKLGLKKLENEASEMSSSLNLKENILKGTTFHSDQCKVSERSIGQSHDTSPASGKEEMSENTGGVNVPSKDEHENKNSLRKLFREFEPFHLQLQPAEKDDTLWGSQRPQAGSSDLLRETFASQPSEYRRVEMKTSDDTNMSQTNCSVKSTCKEDNGQPEEVNETTEVSVVPPKVSGLSSALEKLMEEASEKPPPKPKRAISTEQRAAEVEFKGTTYKHDGEMLQEIRETVEKSVVPPKVSGLSSALEKLMEEAPETPPPKPKHAGSTEQRAAEVEAKDTTFKHDGEVLQEISETVEKSVVPPKVSGLSSALEKLMEEAPETPPPKPKHAGSTEQRAAEVEAKDTTFKHDGEVLQEISETVEKSVVPPKVSGLSSALEKLMEEASEKPPPKPKRAGSTEQRAAEVEAKDTTFKHNGEVLQEISETVEKSVVPPKVSGLSSALEKLMEEGPETPPPKPKHAGSTEQRAAEVEAKDTTFKHNGEVLQEISETVEKSVVPPKVSGLSSALEKLMEEAPETPPPKPKRAGSTEQRAAEVEAKDTTFKHNGEVLQEISETVEKSVVPPKVSGLSSALEKLMEEAPETPPPKPKHAGSTEQRAAEVEAKDTTFKHNGEVLQEISETVEKSVVPPKVSGLSSALEKLMEEAPETPPPKPKRAGSTEQRAAEVEAKDTTFKHNGEVLQEISETVEKSVVPPKVSGLSSALEKLMEEAPETPPPKPKRAGSTEQRAAEVEAKDTTFKHDGEVLQEISETVEKSVVPPKVSGLSSALEKLMEEASETPPPKPKGAGSTEQRAAEVEFKDTTHKHDGEVLQENIETTERSMLSKADYGLLDVNLQKLLKEASETPASELKNMNKQMQGEMQTSQNMHVPHQQERDHPQEIQERIEKTSISNTEKFSEFSSSLEKLLQEASETSSPLSKELHKRDDSNFPQPRGAQFCLASQHKDNEEEEEDGSLCGCKFSDGNSDSYSGTSSSIRSEEELNPVLMALKRSADRKMPSKSLEDIPSATSNKRKINNPKEELALSAEDGPKPNQERNENAARISTVPSQPDKLFSNPDKLKGLSKSVPSFLQEESDDRETDTASESSYSLGRIKKSPSSLTNLSGSSGMASLSSVSGSLMSIYSADFGNVDVKGNIQFAIDYVEQLNELHVFICQCKDLAVADVKRQRSDPYVKTYLLPEKYKLGKRKTSVKKKTFNPVYNEILRYKIEKDLLKNQSLNISVWHNDTFGRNSFLGEVELDLGTWDWNDKSNKQINWFPLKPRTSTISLQPENRGEMKLALQYVPHPVGGKKTLSTGEVHIWVKECHDLPLLRGNRLNSFIKCTVLPDTSRKSRQKTRTVAKTTNPVFNHTMVYDGFRPEDLKEACVELTVWDHNKLANHFLGGLRIGLGTGKSYGTVVEWMDSTSAETALWEMMMNLPNTWVEDTLPLRMLMVAKLTK